MSSDSNPREIDRLAQVIAEMRTRAREYLAYPGVPCQTDSRWHAQEVEDWADQIEALLVELRQQIPPQKKD